MCICLCVCGGGGVFYFVGTRCSHHSTLTPVCFMYVVLDIFGLTVTHATPVHLLLGLVGHRVVKEIFAGMPVARQFRVVLCTPLAVPESDHHAALCIQVHMTCTMHA